VTTFFSGDGELSGFELRLWSLVNEVLLRWHTLVIFKWDRINVPAYKREMIAFYVPGDATYRDEIMAFLRTELRHEVRADHHAEGDAKPGDLKGPHPGTETEIHVEVEPFSGLTPYMTHEQGEKMAREFLSNFLQRAKREGKERKKDEGK
jgi:hypothetical protein